ncbi:unnamed protein product [Rotaria socialis]|uniref:Heparan-alpha-glucosaminide N-acetyltransferase n=1 Tax=Rotaria socialis TaxID=392032 RepID=A0A821P3F3_9BILA|nr:unnamed protein product [Rotaria socialis]
MDEAYLILHSTNYSNSIVLFGNKIVCEGCDFEKIATIHPNRNTTVIINTKYAYDLELRSEPSNLSSLCQITSYKFAEHGTYMFHVVEITSDVGACFIKQIGNPSNYWTPVIVGVIFVVLYIALTQLWHHRYRSQYYNYFLSNILHRQSKHIGQQTVNQSDEDTIRATAELPVTNSIHLPNPRKLPKRLRALDTFRGFSLMVMIFVNYGGGGYSFFDHLIWNGLTLADLVFPWFAWRMGVSIVLSQRSLRKKVVRKRSILVIICRRSIILFVFGLSGQVDVTDLKTLRILGVLARLASCYFFTALIVLLLDKKDNERDVSDSTDVKQTLRTELFNCIFQFWTQWLLVIIITTGWLLITFLLHVPNCPTGYLGPGGKHSHGRYWNCTGGAAGYIDRVVLGNSHLYNDPTCKEIYHTKVPYDPEGILGILTGTLLCYLGVQAGHIFIHCTRTSRICAYWILSGIICGSLGLILSHGGHSNSWIPINKNLWSLTFVLILASLAFFIVTILYLLVDVYRWFTGAPFLWLGMNSIVIYIAHGRFGTSFPVQFLDNNTHVEELAMHLYGSFFWSFVAGFMYYKKVFIAI